MAVLTIARELGSGGRTIAKKAAEALGYRFADKDLIGTILSDFGLVDFPEEYDAERGFWDNFDYEVDAMTEMFNRAIMAIAATDEVVLLGRGCFALLGGYEDVINARIQAPLSERVRRVAAREKIVDHETAFELVRMSDQARATFVDGVYGLDWKDSDSYDLIINTGKIDVEAASSWLIEAVGLVETKPGSGGKRLSQIEVDPVLAEAVEEAFSKIEAA